MTLFLALQWFSICLYILCAIRIELVNSLEAGSKYLIVGSFGSAFLPFARPGRGRARAGNARRSNRTLPLGSRQSTSTATR